jgi:hypothetical protein
VDKKCTICKQNLSLSFFSKDKSRKDGHSAKCKTCAYQMLKNKKASDEEYFLNGAKLRTRKYRENLSLERKEEIKAQQRLHTKLPSVRSRMNESCRRYYSTKNCATPKWLSAEQKAEIAGIYSLAKDCQIVTGEPYHVDHIIPIRGKNVCGLHVPWNLQVLPAEVNVRKNNRYEEAK